MRQKTLIDAALHAVLLLVLVFLVGLRLWTGHSRGFRVRIASDTCEWGGGTPLLLRISAKRLVLGAETVKLSNLADGLADIYGSRRARLLYLAADDDVPFQEVAVVVAIVQQSRHTRASQFRVHEFPLPEALQSQPGDNLNIEIWLVTPGAVAAPCRNGHYNWWYVWNPAHTRPDSLQPAPRMM